jgi:outer membrane receptor protein involved in Fe transport
MYNVNAQKINTLIQGIVIDSLDKKNIPFTSVILESSELNNKVGQVCNSSGFFIFNNIIPGKYILTFSATGYSKNKIHVDILKDSAQINLGKVLLSPEGHILNEVRVVANKLLYEDKEDRLIYNAENDISNQTGSVTDLMYKVPLITVNLDGNIQLRGSSNIRILINGRPSAAMTNNLANALRQLPSRTIKSIEVITNPGAKYDAEGSAGIINIITKRQALGIDANLNSTAGNINNTFGGDVSYGNKKFGFTMSFNGYKNLNKYFNVNERFSYLMPRHESDNYSSYLSQNINRNNISLGGYSDISSNYNIDSTTNINVSFSYWGNKLSNISNQYTIIENFSGFPLQNYNINSSSSNLNKNLEYNISFNKNFIDNNTNRTTSEINVLAQISSSPSFMNNIINLVYKNDFNKYFDRNHNFTNSLEYSFQLDYLYNFKKHRHVSYTIETGVKNIYRILNSEYISQNDSILFVNNSQYYQSIDNSFRYLQNVASSYFSFKIKSDNGWSSILGIRLEDTFYKGEVSESVDNISNRYNNLIPSLLLSKKISKKNTIKFSYTQRLSRPLIDYLNPFVSYNDPKNVQTGNPFLKPELTHTVELSYNMISQSGSSVFTSLFLKRTNNDIQNLITLDNKGGALIRPENIGVNETYGFNVSGSKKILKDFNAHFNINTLHVNLKNIQTKQYNNGFTISSSFSASYKFNKNLLFQVSGYYSTGQIFLQTRSNGFYYYGVTIKKDFTDSKRFSLIFNANNPFTSKISIVTKSYGSDFSATNISNLLTNRNFKISLIFQLFKNNSYNRDAKKIINDDIKKIRSI